MWTDGCYQRVVASSGPFLTGSGRSARCICLPVTRGSNGKYSSGKGNTSMEEMREKYGSERLTRTRTLRAS